MRLPIHRTRQEALSTYQKRHKPKWYYEVDAIETHTGRNEQDFNKKDPGPIEVNQDMTYLCLKLAFTGFEKTHKNMGLKKSNVTATESHI